MSKIHYDKIFPCPPNKKYNSLMIDNESVRHITPYKISENIVSIIDSHIPERIDRKKVNIMDATACVGGDSISFSKRFGYVVSCEINKNKYKMLVNNINLYGLSNIIHINDDCLNIYDKINFLDIIYFDPPWGGSSYKLHDKITLSINDLLIDDIIINILSGNIRSNIKIIALKLPKNYDIASLFFNTMCYDDAMYYYDFNVYDLGNLYLVIYSI